MRAKNGTRETLARRGGSGSIWPARHRVRRGSAKKTGLRHCIKIENGDNSVKQSAKKDQMAYLYRMYGINQ